MMNLEKELNEWKQTISSILKERDTSLKEQIERQDLVEK